MDSTLEPQLRRLQNHDTHLLLKGVLHGIEKEGLRVDASGDLSLSPHPKQLGAPLTNSSITTDFSESLLESPGCDRQCAPYRRVAVATP